MMARKLARRLPAWRLDKANGWLAGVCAGLAGALRLAPTLARVAFVVAVLFTPTPVIAIYLVAWAVLDS